MACVHMHVQHGMSGIPTTQMSERFQNLNIRNVRGKRPNISRRESLPKGDETMILLYITCIVRISINRHNRRKKLTMGWRKYHQIDQHLVKWWATRRDDKQDPSYHRWLADNRSTEGRRRGRRRGGERYKKTEPTVALYMSGAAHGPYV